MINQFVNETIGTYVCLTIMFQKPLCVLLVFVILSSGFTKLLLYAGYELNKDYISNTFCVNKAKPVMQCKGKCYLAKKLKQADQSEQKQGQSSIKRYLVEAFLPTGERFKYFTKQIGVCLPKIEDFHSSITANSIFHPPKSNLLYSYS